MSDQSTSGTGSTDTNADGGKGGDESTTDTTTTDTGKGSTDGPKTFTEAQVQEMIQERLKTTNARHGEKVKGILGDRSQDDVAAILAAHDERTEKEKTDAQRATEAAEKAKVEAEKATATALMETTLAKLTRKLSTPGKDAEGKPLAPVQDDFMETVLEIALPLALKAPDGTEDPIAYAVDLVRVKAAPMFGTSETKPNGNGSTRPAPGPGRTHGEGKDATPGDAVAAYMARQGIKPTES